MFGSRKTPTTETGLRKYDDLPAAEAVLKAWTEAGNHPAWDYERKQETRQSLPLLARALDRLERDGLHAGGGRHSTVRRRP